jgi:hypothetical protein
VEKRACQTVRSSSFLISCTINQILRLPAFCRKRCAVQHDRVPSSRLPAHPRAAPGKEKVGGLVGLLSWVLVDLGCVLRSLRCLASSLSLVHSFFCLLDSLHDRSRLVRRSMGRSHGALSQHVLSCGRMIILSCPSSHCYLQTVSGVHSTASSTFCTTSDSSSQPNQTKRGACVHLTMRRDRVTIT